MSTKLFGEKSLPYVDEYSGGKNFAISRVLGAFREISGRQYLQKPIEKRRKMAYYAPFAKLYLRENLSS